MVSNGYSRTYTLNIGIYLGLVQGCQLKSGVISLTYAAQFTLRIALVQSLPDLLQKGAQRQQVDHAKSRPPGSDATEDVGRCKICQSNGNARQPPVGRTIDHPFIAPVLTPADQVK
jgi:hypothetical protein